MYLRRQREYVCIGLKNANAYVPMLSADNQVIPVCAGCHTFVNSFFKDRSGEFGLFQARAVDTGNSHRLTARLY